MIDILDVLRLYQMNSKAPIYGIAADEIERLRTELGQKECKECCYWFKRTKRAKFCSKRCKNRWHARARRARMREESK